MMQLRTWCEVIYFICAETKIYSFRSTLVSVGYISISMSKGDWIDHVGVLA